MNSNKRHGKQRGWGRLRRRELLVLAGFWAAGCVIVTVLLGFFYANSVAEVSDEPRPVATFEVPFDEAQTAKAAYRVGLSEAQAWQDDVELVAISTRWSEASVQDLSTTEVWDFRFFSEERDRIFFAAVYPEREEVEGQAHLFKLNHTTVNKINMADWIIDSDEALSIWINNGGGVFLQNSPGSSVELLLRQAPDLQRPVWDIIGITANQAEIFFLTIDATNGEMLN